MKDGERTHREIQVQGTFSKNYGSKIQKILFGDRTDYRGGSLHKSFKDGKMEVEKGQGDARFRKNKDAVTDQRRELLQQAAGESDHLISTVKSRAYSEAIINASGIGKEYYDAIEI